MEIRTLAEVLATNWGRVEGKTGRGNRFQLCPDCGRHLPYDPRETEHAAQIRDWLEYHGRFCDGRTESLVLCYRFQTDCLLLSVPSRGDEETHGRATLSPSLVTLAEALLVGAGELLELEPNELAAFPRKRAEGALGDQIVFYETVPGGAGYLEEMARRLPDVAAAAMQGLYGHTCLKSCYLCLKRYGNQRWHPFFDKDQVRDLLLILSQQDPVEPEEAEHSAGLRTLERMLSERTEGGNPALRRYPKGEIEEPLYRALQAISGLPSPERDYEVHDREGQLVTVPDFTWPDLSVAVYCDGFAVHGNRGTLEQDARKRNYLQAQGWAVLTYWGRTILRGPGTCAEQVAAVVRERLHRQRR